MIIFLNVKVSITRYLWSLLFLIVSFPVLSQTPGLPLPDQLDTDKIAFAYMHVEYDKDLDDEVMKRFILQIGNKWLRYCSVGTYVRDSIFFSMNAKDLDLETQFKIALGTHDSSHFVMTDLKNSKIQESQYIMGSRLIYEEDIPEFKWNITGEEKDYNGIKVKKATTRFRGRNWTAWYAPDIAYPYGPWKFRGLPGLILEIYDDNKNHHIYYFTKRQSKIPITKMRSDFEKTTREKYLKTLYQGYKGGGLRGMYENPDAIPTYETLHYVPIELE